MAQTAPDRIYNGPLIPEERVISDWTLFQTEQDPVAQATVEWLMRQ